MKPETYSELTPEGIERLREEYVEFQNGLCYWCDQPLDEDPPQDILGKEIKWHLFGGIEFLDNPIHLQHDHFRDKTEGAVHAYCNAVMWQYYHR